MSLFIFLIRHIKEMLGNITTGLKLLLWNCQAAQPEQVQEQLTTQSNGLLNFSVEQVLLKAEGLMIFLTPQEL